MLIQQLRDAIQKVLQCQISYKKAQRLEAIHLPDMFDVFFACRQSGTTSEADTSIG